MQGEPWEQRLTDCPHPPPPNMGSGTLLTDKETEAREWTTRPKSVSKGRTEHQGQVSFKAQRLPTLQPDPDTVTSAGRCLCLLPEPGEKAWQLIEPTPPQT